MGNIDIIHTVVTSTATQIANKVQGSPVIDKNQNTFPLAFLQEIGLLTLKAPEQQRTSDSFPFFEHHLD